MKSSILSLLLLLAAIPALGNEIGFIDINIFGKSINEPIKILEKGTLIPKEYRPVMVNLDHNASTYYAAQVEYELSLGFNNLVKAFSEKYGIEFSDPTPNNFTFGRSVKYRFACQVSQEEEYLRVIYIFRDKIEKAEWNVNSKKALKNVGLECLIPALEKQ
jgi:hypothetical protein